MIRVSCWLDRWRSSWKELLPIVLIGICAAAMVMATPSMPFHDDAAQYEVLARSVLHGQFQLDGQPTMLREPGYPVFKAVIYVLRGGVRTVLWVQVLFVMLTAYLWLRSWRLVSPSFAWLGSWGTFAAYGYWLFAARSLYEVVLGFWLALGFFTILSFWKQPAWWRIGAAGLSFSCLLMTRAVYELLWIPVFCVFWWLFGKSVLAKRELLKYAALFSLFVLLLPLGWSLRNGRTFHNYTLADRSGLVLMCRAVLLLSTPREYLASVGSVALGEQAVERLFPRTKPIVDQQWQLAAQIALEQAGYSATSSLTTLSHAQDTQLFSQAKHMIFASPQSFVWFVAWTPLELARLFGLPSPEYPQVDMETMLRGHSQPLPRFEIAIVIAIQLVQLIYWALILYGLWRMWRVERRGVFFALPFLYLALIHAGLDNVARFSAPVQPCLMMFALFGLSEVGRSVFKSR